MNATIQIPPQDIRGDGSSIWGESTGVFTVDSVTVDYVNWASYPDDIKEDRIHASVTLGGPTTRCEHYTDDAIEKGASKNKVIMEAVRMMVQQHLDKAKIKQQIPAGIYLNWSEWGMQPEKGWNFDLCPLTKGKK